jgi:hypothetical protein
MLVLECCFENFPMRFLAALVGSQVGLALVGLALVLPAMEMARVEFEGD